MNIQYAKTILYAYPQLKKMIKQNDKLIKKKAFESSEDIRSATIIFDEIIDLKLEKGLLFDLGVSTATALAKLDPVLLDYIRYGYFRVEVESVKNDSPKHRFDMRKKATNKFAKALDNAGITDEAFETLLSLSENMRAFLDNVIQKDNENEEKTKKRLASIKANKG